MSLPPILIIEDGPKLAHIFGEALQAAELETELIKGGDTALDRLVVTTTAVVVLDLHLPEVSGEAILRQIRADERLAGTSVVIASPDPHLAKTAAPI